MSTMLAEPKDQKKSKVRKYRGYFIVPVPHGYYEVWSPNGVLKGSHPNVSRAKQWIAHRRAA